MVKPYFFVLTLATLTVAWVYLLGADRNPKPAAPLAAATTAATARTPPSEPIKIIPKPSDAQPESFDPPFTINSPPAPPLSPEDALKTFKLPADLKIEIAAAEPLVEVPVAIAWDPDGRLWVVEMRSYMPNLRAEGENQPISRVSILEDADGDGRYEKSTIFLDNLV